MSFARPGKYWRLMQAIIDPHAGPCPGVTRALGLVEAQLQKPETLHALGAVIHNDKEMRRLQDKGLKVLDQPFIENSSNLEELSKQRVFIRSHGISPQLERKLADSRVCLVDATCGKVKRVQQLAEHYFRQGYRIIIAGKKGHPEVNGIAGYCNNEAVIVANKAELPTIKQGEKLALIAQTTIAREQFIEISAALQALYKDVVVIDTTCSYINKRHQQIQEFAASVNVVLLVGGKSSSNTAVLFKICKKANPRSYHIEAPEDINMDWFDPEDIAGITGSASTPLWQLQQILQFLQVP